MSEHDVSQVARAQIARAANVPSASLHISEVSVGEYKGNGLICGVVTGPSISLRRFIFLNTPDTGVMFERPKEIGLHETYDFDLQWDRICVVSSIKEPQARQFPRSSVRKDFASRA